MTHLTRLLRRSNKMTCGKHLAQWQAHGHGCYMGVMSLGEPSTRESRRVFIRHTCTHTHISCLTGQKARKGPPATPSEAQGLSPPLKAGGHLRMAPTAIQSCLPARGPEELSPLRSATGASRCGPRRALQSLAVLTLPQRRSSPWRLLWLLQSAWGLCVCVWGGTHLDFLGQRGGWTMPDSP